MSFPMLWVMLSTYKSSLITSFLLCLRVFYYLNLLVFAAMVFLLFFILNIHFAVTVAAAVLQYKWKLHTHTVTLVVAIPSCSVAWTRSCVEPTLVPGSFNRSSSCVSRFASCGTCGAQFFCCHGAMILGWWRALSHKSGTGKMCVVYFWFCMLHWVFSQLLQRMNANWKES